jgi:excinuclease ABC subunit C
MCPKETSETAFDAKTFLRRLTHKPGVYQMLDASGQVIYVGKARDLKKRVASYFGAKAHHPKTTALMGKMADIEVTVTTNEQEALLLEYNLIKAHQPRFNVLLRDDKSYPYIYVSSKDKFPRFSFHRGARKAPGRFLGPFPNAGAVRQSLSQVQKLFRIRQCEDSFFSNRTRPCLQHQIKRCSAPCVGLIDAAAYSEDVNNAMLCLDGRSDAVSKDLTARMDAAAAEQAYELAARLRDQIASLQVMQSNQTVSGGHYPDTDVLAACELQGRWCVALLMIRGGRVLGSRNYFPQTTGGAVLVEVVEAFLLQHYFATAVPAEIIVNELPETAELLGTALSAKETKPAVIRSRVRGTRRGWLDLAEANAREALQMRQSERATVNRQFDDLVRVLQLGEIPQRIECFDISHTSGEKTVASCVVFGPNGAIKSDYRRFNIKDIEPGDDYAAMAQVIRRRYTRVLKEEAVLPDLIIVDGGKGQLSVAQTELEAIQLTQPALIGIAKGPERKPGEETLFAHRENREINLPGNSPALHLLQQIRDEAHRFAITGHRQRRGKARQKSTLENIPGVGAKRRRDLLRHFGGLQGIRKAGVHDLRQVAGISEHLAQLIYDRFHTG